MKTLVEYIRHPKTNARSGVVLAYREGNDIKIGWSVAHSQLDTFNKNIGLSIARERARTDYMGEIPAFAIPYYEKMIDRARRYYKIEPVKSKGILAKLLEGVKLW